MRPIAPLLNRWTQNTYFQLRIAKLVECSIETCQLSLFVRGASLSLTTGWRLVRGRAEAISVDRSLLVNFDASSYDRPDAHHIFRRFELGSAEMQLLSLSGTSDMLVLPIRDANELVGLLWLEREERRGSFSSAEKLILANLAPWISLAARASVDADVQAFQLAAEGAPGKDHMLFDLVAKRVVWYPSTVDMPAALLSDPAGLANVVEEWLAQRAADEALFPAPVPGFGTVTGVSEVQGPHGQTWAAITFVVGDVRGALSLLSKREQTVAKMLVDGRAAGDIAILVQISEHTVRTYIRRIYRKLGIYNRSELVRCLCSGR